MKTISDRFFNDLKKRSIKNVIKKYEALEIYEDIINVVFSIKKNENDPSLYTSNYYCYDIVFLIHSFLGFHNIGGGTHMSELIPSKHICYCREKDEFLIGIIYLSSLRGLKMTT